MYHKAAIIPPGPDIDRNHNYDECVYTIFI